MNTLDTQYNAFGTANPQPLGDNSPKSNPGLVYQPANEPVTPGTVQTGQPVASLTFQSSYNLRRIRIVMNPGDNPAQTAGSIAIIDESNRIIWSSGDTDAASGSIQYISPSQGDLSSLVILPTTAEATTFDQLIIDIQNGSSTATGAHITVAGSGDSLHAQHASGTGYPLRTTNALTVNSHFSPMIKTQGVAGASPVVWVSDGTTPNGTLSATKGDICLNASATGQMAYCTGTTNWTTL